MSLEQSLTKRPIEHKKRLLIMRVNENVGHPMSRKYSLVASSSVLVQEWQS
jgi:hypothetical protein